MAKGMEIDDDANPFTANHIAHIRVSSIRDIARLSPSPSPTLFGTPPPLTNFTLRPSPDPTTTIPPPTTETMTNYAGQADGAATHLNHPPTDVVAVRQPDYLISDEGIEPDPEAGVNLQVTREQGVLLVYATARLPYERACGADPNWVYDNLHYKQFNGWPKKGPNTVIVFVAYEGVPRSPTDTTAVTIIKDVLAATVGEIPNLTVIEPAPVKTLGPRDAPFCYLIQGIDEHWTQLLLSLHVISCEKGTIFFHPNRAVIGTFLFNLEHVKNANNDTFCAHIHRRFDEEGVNNLILSYAAGNPLFANWTREQVIAHVRGSLRVNIVFAKKNGADHTVANIHMESPTHAPLRWRELQAQLASIDYTDDEFGMHIRVEREWVCSICKSQTHPTGLCPLATDPTWFTPPNRPFESKKDKDSKPAQPTPAPEMAYTSERIANARPPRGRGNGKGNGRGGRGNRGGRRN